MAMPSDKPVGKVRFTDGSIRTVYLDQTGRQYVLGDDEQPVFGLWLLPESASEERCSRNGKH